MKGKFNIDTPVVLLLFSVFAACVMMVLVLGANVYKSSAGRDAAALDARTAQQYMTAKLRRQDGSDCRPYVTDFDGNVLERGPVLEFVEEIDGEAYRTDIYCLDGRVYELFTLAGLPFEKGSGEYVLEAESLAFEDTGDGIRVVMTVTDGSLYDFYVGFMSRIGGVSVETE